MRHAPPISIVRVRGAPGFYVYASGDPDISITVQTDYDYPGLAQAFGMRLRHNPGCADPGFTDGTVDCLSCGRTAAQFIRQATRYLLDHEGKVVEDPGYLFAGHDEVRA